MLKKHIRPKNVTKRNDFSLTETEVTSAAIGISGSIAYPNLIESKARKKIRNIDNNGINPSNRQCLN
jgi:hypothetical protein